MCAKRYLSEKEMYDILMNSSDEDDNNDFMCESDEENISSDDNDNQENLSVDEDGDVNEDLVTSSEKRKKSEYEWKQTDTFIPTVFDFLEDKSRLS